MQVITEYSDEQLSMVLEATEKLEAHLTAAVVSNDAQFTQKVQCFATPAHEQHEGVPYSESTAMCSTINLQPKLIAVRCFCRCLQTL